jgi:hypothetical protein
MKRAVLILAAIAFLIIPLMIYLGVPLQEGFADDVDKPSIWTKTYHFFIGTSTEHIIAYVILGVLVFGGLGFWSAGRSAVPAPMPALPQAGGKRRGR